MCLSLFVSKWSYGPPHMAVQKQDDQHEHTFSSYVRILDVFLKTYLGRWTIGSSGERGSGISVLPARHDDDDDDIHNRSVHMNMAMLPERQDLTGRSHHGVMVKALDCGIVVLEFELQSRYRVHFQTNNLEKGMNSPIDGLNSSTTDLLKKVDLTLNNQSTNQTRFYNRCLSTSWSFTELRTTSFIESTGSPVLITLR